MPLPHWLVFAQRDQIYSLRRRRRLEFSHSQVRRNIPTRTTFALGDLSINTDQYLSTYSVISQTSISDEREREERGEEPFQNLIVWSNQRPKGLLDNSSWQHSFLLQLNIFQILFELWNISIQETPPGALVVRSTWTIPKCNFNNFFSKIIITNLMNWEWEWEE